jgi:hypothetical protein
LISGNNELYISHKPTREKKNKRSAGTDLDLTKQHTLERQKRVFFVWKKRKRLYVGDLGVQDRGRSG